MSHKNGLYTAAIALAVVVLVNKYGNKVGVTRHGS